MSQTIESCRALRATANPRPSRKESMLSIFQNFNDVVCTDHLYSGSLCLFHGRPNTVRFSAAYIVNDAFLSSAALFFDSCGMNPFWTPRSIKADRAFTEGKLKKYCDDRGTTVSPIAHNRQGNDTIESKHSATLSIFPRLQTAILDADKDVLAA